MLILSVFFSTLPLKIGLKIYLTFHDSLVALADLI